MKRKYSSKLVCQACGVKWIDHIGMNGLCAENARLRDIIQRASHAYANSPNKPYDRTAHRMIVILNEEWSPKS